LNLKKCNKWMSVIIFFRNVKQVYDFLFFWSGTVNEWEVESVSEWIFTLYWREQWRRLGQIRMRKNVFEKVLFEMPTSITSVRVIPSFNNWLLVLTEEGTISLRFWREVDERIKGPEKKRIRNIIVIIHFQWKDILNNILVIH
jgi:hypothetical protein